MQCQSISPFSCFISAVCLCQHVCPCTNPCTNPCMHLVSSYIRTSPFSMQPVVPSLRAPSPKKIFNFLRKIINKAQVGIIVLSGVCIIITQTSHAYNVCIYACAHANKNTCIYALAGWSVCRRLPRVHGAVDPHQTPSPARNQLEVDFMSLTLPIY